jgi:hypothetical protein
MGPLVNSVREAICWSGPAVINLFTLGRVEEPLQEGAFDISGVRPEGLETFRMRPGSGMSELISWEYDLTFSGISESIIPYLLLCLESTSTHADGVAWLAFEGSFHFDHLFTEDVAEQIYGYCVIGSEPVVIWDGEILKSGRWKRRISDVKYFVDRSFMQDDPNLE